MGTKNEELYEEAERAIDELYGDYSVEIEETLNNMHMLQGKINELIDCLELDKENSKKED